jgi:hypothetical protein
MLYEALRQRRRNAPPSDTRTPRPEPREEPQNGEEDPDAGRSETLIESLDEQRRTESPRDGRSVPAEAPEGGTDETDQVAPAAALEESPDQPAGEKKPEKPKRAKPATPRKRAPKKAAE